MVAQIAVTFAECVGYFRYHYDQAVIIAPAQPKADGVEDVTEQPRLSQKFNTDNTWNLVLRQYITHPRSPSSCAYRATVINIVN